MGSATLKAKRSTFWGQLGPQLNFSWTVAISRRYTHTLAGTKTPLCDGSGAEGLEKLAW